jgi:hypothetical protein
MTQRTLVKGIWREYALPSLFLASAAIMSIGWFYLLLDALFSFFY